MRCGDECEFKLYKYICHVKMIAALRSARISYRHVRGTTIDMCAVQLELPKIPATNIYIIYIICIIRMR